jgi:tRNA pseudouridine55 synthase
VDGVLVVDKPDGPTSHDVVAVARRALRARQVGHAGTLDPMATGVLVLMVGSATRLARFFSDQPKSYDAILRLGLETDSGDRTGAVVARAPEGTAWPDAVVVREALDRLRGTLEQRPPALSAKWVAGARAYTLARAGAEVPVRAVPVTLHEAEVGPYDPPLLRLSIRCSAGFYVRALARDLGRLLGCGACLEALRRTASADFVEGDAVPLDLLVRDPEAAAARLVPLDRLLLRFPAARLSASGERKARHGNDLLEGDLADPAPACPAGGVVRLVAGDGRLMGLARPAAPPAVLHPAVVLQ